MITKKVTLFIIAGVLVLVAAGSGYYVYVQKDKDLLKTQQQTVSDFNNNNLDSAIAKAQELSKEDKTKVEGLLLLATSYVQKGSVEFKEKEYGDKAIVTAQEVLKIDSKNAEAYRLIGYAYEIQQNYPEAMKNYDASISLDSGNALTFTSRGHAYYLMGDNKKAETDFLTSTSLNPAMETALLNLARISYSVGDYEKAEQYLSKITDPNSPALVKSDAQTLLALIKESKFDLEGALDSFNKALALNPKSPYIMVNIAQVKMSLLFKKSTVIKKTDVEKLIADVNEAIEINPLQTSAYLTIGKMKALIGDSKGAQEQFAKAKEVVLKDITLSSLEKKNIQDEIARTLSMEIKEVKK